MTPLHTLIKDTLLYAKQFEAETMFCTSQELAEHQPMKKQAHAEKTLTLPSVKKAPIETLKPPEKPPEKNLSLQRITKPKENAPSPDLMRATLSKLVPGLKLTENIPEDSSAKQKANEWQQKLTGVSFVLLALSQEEETLDLLKGLAKAIDSRFGKTKIMAGKRLETDEQWESFFESNELRLVIISDPKDEYPKLKELIEEDKGLVDNTPCIVLKEIALYKEIARKAELWKAICQHA